MSSEVEGGQRAWLLVHCASPLNRTWINDIATDLDPDFWVQHWFGLRSSGFTTDESLVYWGRHWFGLGNCVWQWLILGLLGSLLIRTWFLSSPPIRTISWSSGFTTDSYLIFCSDLASRAMRMGEDHGGWVGRRQRSKYTTCRQFLVTFLSDLYFHFSTLLCFFKLYTTGRMGKNSGGLVKLF